MRKFFTFVIIFAVVLGIFSYTAFTSTRFWEFVVPRVVALKSKDIKIEYIAIRSVTFQGLGQVTWKAVDLIVGFNEKSYPLSIDHIYLKDLHSIKAENMHANMYDGMVRGSAIVDLGPVLDYTVDMEFKHIDTTRLGDINAAISDNVKGMVEGNLHLTVKGDDITALKAQCRMLPQGTIKAELLQYLAQYLPQRQQLEGLIKNNEDIPLDKSSVVINSSGSQKFLYNVNLYASQLNLNMNVDIDMNMDGSVQDLMKTLKQGGL